MYIQFKYEVNQFLTTQLARKMTELRGRSAQHLGVLLQVVALRSWTDRRGTELGYLCRISGDLLSQTDTATFEEDELTGDLSTVGHQKKDA